MHSFRSLRRCLLCVFLLIVCLGVARAKDEPSLPDPRDQLHVFVFEDLSDPAPQAAEYAVDPLTDANVPVLVSEAALPSLTGFGGVIVGLPSKLMFLDVETIDAAELSRSGHWYKRNNQVASLRYEIRVSKWMPDGLVIDVKANYRRQKWSVGGVVADPHVTTLLRLNGKHPIGLALTRLDQIDFRCGQPEGALFDKSPVEIPKLTAGPSPKFPDDLQATGRGDVVKISTCIGTTGRIRPYGFVLLECSHPRFAEEATKVLLEEWQFEPGRYDGRPVSVKAVVEVQFNLRRHFF